MPHESDGVELAPNQHDPAIDAESTRVALLAALDYWERAACECCAPTVLDDAIDRIGYEVPLWERMRRFGIALAQTAQNVLDEEAE